MNSIYEYTDYRTFLKDLFSERRKNQPSFSIRGLSIKAGIKSPGFLSMVLSEKRNITVELARRIATILKLPPKDQKYFILMIEYSHTTHLESKHNILKQMLNLTSSNHVRNLLPEQFEFYDKWYYSVIREMIEIVNTDDTNFEQLSKKLNPPVDPHDVFQALNILNRLGLIHKDQNGRYRRTDTIISCGENVKSVIISNFQSKMIELAGIALKETPKGNRDFSTVTLSVDEKAWSQIIEHCKAFRKELLSIANNVNQPDRTIQINFQCFPVSKTGVSE